MKRKTTIKEIAKKANLSIATVSRAINPDTRYLVGKTTFKRITTIIEREHYFPSQSARRLVTGKSYNIVIFFKPEFKSAFYNDYFSKMFAGAMSAVEDTPYNLLISLIRDEKNVFEIDEAIYQLDVGAAILCNFMGLTRLSATNVFNMEIPIIIINQHSQEKNPNCFLIDNLKGGYTATQYLIEKGHIDIGFIRGISTVKDAEDRFAGYKLALEDAGIPFSPDLCFDGNFVEESGKRAAQYFFTKSNVRPSAIFSANDEMAIGLINGIESMGLKCPDDVSVIGFDGISTGEFTKPALTSVSQPIYEMAHDAIKELICIRENNQTFKGTRYFNAKIIERESVVTYTK